MASNLRPEGSRTEVEPQPVAQTVIAYRILKRHVSHRGPLRPLGTLAFAVDPMITSRKKDTSKRQWGSMEEDNWVGGLRY